MSGKLFQGIPMVGWKIAARIQTIAIVKHWREYYQVAEIFLANLSGMRPLNSQYTKAEEAVS